MYRQIHCIGYELYTGPQFINRAIKVYPGLMSEFDDLAGRLKWIAQVVDTAQKAFPGKGRSAEGEILRVCMMPEFLMRGSQGAYDLRTVDLGVRFLQDLVSDRRFADWLFVFGTLVGRSHPTMPSPSGEIIDPDAPVEAYNLCPVIRGGWKVDGIDEATARVAATKVVLKEQLSNIDFIKITENAGTWARVGYLAPGGPAGPGRERQRRPDDGGAIFTIDGITFGLEICLDHDEGRLKDSPPQPGEPLIQVQLIPSCGMSIQPRSVVAIKDGLVFNVDGFLRHHTAVQMVATPSSFANPDAALRDPPGARRAIDLPPTPENFSEFYIGGPGQLWSYDPIDLPAAINA